MNNIDYDKQGAVVAAPDLDTPGGSYVFHWMRDSALTMKTFMILNDHKFSDIEYNMSQYVKWVQKVQSKPDPHGQSVLNEPKFELPSGDVYKGDWCRPQTDGTGLRAVTMIKWAQILLENNKDISDLWNQQGNGVIQKDLDYVSENW